MKPHANAIPTEDQLRLVGARVALYASDPGAPLPVRLIAHVLNVALMLVMLPLGAYLTARSLRRGADLGLSVRMTVMAGVLLALTTTPQAQGLYNRLSETVLGQEFSRALTTTRITGDISTVL